MFMSSLSSIQSAYLKGLVWGKLGNYSLSCGSEDDDLIVLGHFFEKFVGERTD